MAWAEHSRPPPAVGGYVGPDVAGRVGGGTVAGMGPAARGSAETPLRGGLRFHGFRGLRLLPSAATWFGVSGFAGRRGRQGLSFAWAEHSRPPPSVGGYAGPDAAGRVSGGTVAGMGLAARRSDETPLRGGAALSRLHRPPPPAVGGCAGPDAAGRVGGGTVAAWAWLPGALTRRRYERPVRPCRAWRAPGARSDFVLETGAVRAMLAWRDGAFPTLTTLWARQSLIPDKSGVSLKS